MNEADLRDEAVLFGRYLIGNDPGDALVERYCRANAALLAGARTDEDERVLAFIRKHPWSIAMLDAAAGLFASTSLLRKKLLVMSAIVETTPELATRFEPPAIGLPRLIVRLGTAGARTAFHAATGLALSAWVKRRA